jgi:ATP-dependent Clp protease ATP-binding subunit ClpC
VFERFTEDARQAIVLAQEEARTLRHNYIGTEHVLLGLLRQEGRAARILESLGATDDGVRDQVRRIVGQGEEPPPQQIPFTPRAKKVLELALRESLGLGHDDVAAEHILLGLARENEGVATRILLDLDIGADKLRAAVIAFIEGNPHAAKTSAGAVRAIPGWQPITVDLDPEMRELLVKAAGRAMSRGATLISEQDLLYALAPRLADWLGVEASAIREAIDGTE